MNKCNYCVEHHFTGLKRLLKDDNKAEHFFEAVKSDTMKEYFNNKYFMGINYAKKLTLGLKNIKKEDIERLKTSGFSEGEILEINQVASYFNYVNRTVIGLGVNTKGDVLGLSPNDSNDPKNWSHQ